MDVAIVVLGGAGAFFLTGDDLVPVSVVGMLLTLLAMFAAFATFRLRRWNAPVASIDGGELRLVPTGYVGRRIALDDVRRIELDRAWLHVRHARTPRARERSFRLFWSDFEPEALDDFIACLASRGIDVIDKR